MCVQVALLFTTETAPAQYRGKYWQTPVIHIIKGIIETFYKENKKIKKFN